MAIMNSMKSVHVLNLPCTYMYKHIQLYLCTRACAELQVYKDYAARLYRCEHIIIAEVEVPNMETHFYKNQNYCSLEEYIVSSDVTVACYTH